ncbi:hypothetical protein ACQUW5_02980 [Legionella sp. CNM-1927-20]|uniref:hypothetical protein n=1 Tax=Legionella sp. CNM-1927-20 TaxID=3422221 RepID=UPI00403AAB9D
MWILIIIFICLTLFIIPFIPAIYEWQKKTDAGSFFFNFEDRSIVSYYKRQFEHYIDSNFNAMISSCIKEDKEEKGKLADGTEYYVIASSQDINLKATDLEDEKTKKLILFCKPIVTPPQIFNEDKIFALDSIHIGKKNIIYDLYAKKDIHLGEESQIKNFIYSGSDIYISKNCDLSFYAQSLNKIEFIGSATFQCLMAPLIQFGNVTDAQAIPEISFDNYDFNNIERLISKKSLVIAQNSQVKKHYIMKNSLQIEENAHVTGNIKVYKELHINNNVVIDGSVICEGNIFIGNNCKIQGPIITYGKITFGKDCIIGTQQDSTSVVADKVVVSQGCLFTGLLLAKRGGYFNVNA